MLFNVYCGVQCGGTVSEVSTCQVSKACFKCCIKCLPYLFLLVNYSVVLSPHILIFRMKYAYQPYLG